MVKKNTGLGSLKLEAGAANEKTEPVIEQQSSSKKRASSKVQRAIYFPEEMDRQLQELVFEEKRMGNRGASVTGLVIEAVNLLFVNRDLKIIK